ncbi:MAG: type IV pilus assembly protein PilM [Armatimonadetes bacterium]|nr:MAG: type IV pilus assembly protein PilM [Armatimonadota bacterium]
MGGLIVGMSGPSPKRGFGIDIGSRVLQLAEISRQGDQLHLEGIGAFPLAPGFVEQGVVTDPRGLAKGLRSYLRQTRIRSRKVTFSIPSSSAVIRWLKLPPLEGSELREAAKFKVKRHLPFPVDQAYVEATPLDVNQGEEEVEHLVVSVPRRVIDSRAMTLEHAGLEPVCAELEAQAILRIVDSRLRRKSPLWSDASLTIIDIGGTMTHMYVIQSRRLHFMRGVPFGAELFVQSVAMELGVSFESAAQLLASDGAQIDETGTLQVRTEDLVASIPLQQELEKLTREFLRLLRYFRSLHPERSYAGILDHVLLCGGMAGLKGLDAYLAERLELRVERMRPLANMVGSFDPDSFAAISARQEAFTVVVGLALSGVGLPWEGFDTQEGENEFVWARAA